MCVLQFNSMVIWMMRKPACVWSNGSHSIRLTSTVARLVMHADFISIGVRDSSVAFYSLSKKSLAGPVAAIDLKRVCLKYAMRNFIEFIEHRFRMKLIPCITGCRWIGHGFKYDWPRLISGCGTFATNSHVKLWFFPNWYVNIINTIELRQVLVDMHQSLKSLEIRWQILPFAVYVRLPQRIWWY